jgi:hypothetical protein
MPLGKWQKGYSLRDALIVAQREMQRTQNEISGAPLAYWQRATVSEAAAARDVAARTWFLAVHSKAENAKKTPAARPQPSAAKRVKTKSKPWIIC